MEEVGAMLTVQDIEKEEPVTLKSPKNPTPTETVFLSNIDQTLAFPVGTVFFFDVIPSMKHSTVGIAERVKKAMSDVFLIPYYFMAGRLNYNAEDNRLELVCNNAGVSFVSAMSTLRLKDLGDLRLPNPSFQHLIVRVGRQPEELVEAPIFTIQITRFKCGGFSVGFVTNHSLLDGRAAAEMFRNLGEICRGNDIENIQNLNTHVFNIDRTCIKARIPPEIKYPHKEYIKQSEISSICCSSFTLQNHNSSNTLSHTCKLFTFTPTMLSALKHKANNHLSNPKCSTFEAIVAHLWRARTKSVFVNDPDKESSVLFAVDIRSKISPKLAKEFHGNAVITASATANVVELDERPFSFSVEKVRQAIEGVSDEYVRSVIDWLEVHKGVPKVSLNGNFYVSAWWKLGFYELDFGHGRPVYGGPVVGGVDDFVLLLSDGSNGGGINVWIALEEEKMKMFMSYVFEI